MGYQHQWVDDIIIYYFKELNHSINIDDDTVSKPSRQFYCDANIGDELIIQFIADITSKELLILKIKYPNLVVTPNVSVQWTTMKNKFKLTLPLPIIDVCTTEYLFDIQTSMNKIINISHTSNTPEYKIWIWYKAVDLVTDRYQIHFAATDITDEELTILKLTFPTLVIRRVN